MKNRSLFDYLLFGSAWVFLGKILIAFSAFIIAILVTRLLSPAEAAVYWLASSIAAFFSLITRFGLDNTLLKVVSENLALDKYDSAAKTVIRGGGSLAIISICFLIVFFASYLLYSSYFVISNYWSAVLIGLILLWSVLLSFQAVVAEVFRAYKEVPFAVIFGGLASGVIAIALMLGVFLFKETITLQLAVMLIVASVGISALVSYMVLFKYVIEIEDWRSELRFSFVLFRQAKSYWLNAIFHYVLSYTGLWSAGLLLSENDVAHYGAAMRLSVLIGMPLMIVNALVPALIARLNAKNDIRCLERVIRGTATLASIPSICVLLFFVIFSDQIIVWAFGQNYLGGAKVFNILVFGQVASVLSGSCGYLLLMTGNQRVMMYITIFSAVICTMISVSVASFYGVVGIALAVTFVIVIQQFITVIFAHNKTGVWSHIGIRDTITFFKYDLNLR